MKMSSRGVRRRIVLVSGSIVAVLLAGIVGLIYLFARPTELPCNLEKSRESKVSSTHSYDDVVAAGMKQQLISDKKGKFVVQKKIVRVKNEESQQKSCECVGEPPILQQPLERHWFVTDQIALYTCPFTENKTVAIANCNLKHCAWEVKFVSSCPVLAKECTDEPPKLDTDIIGDDWDGHSKFIDTKVHYYCLNDLTFSSIQIAVCSENQSWNFVYNHNSSMNCSCDKLPPSPESQNIHVNWNESKIYGSVASYACIGDKVIQTAVCTSTSGWVLQNNSSWKELFEDNCECRNDFPKLNLTFNIKWIDKLRHIGNVITYFCYENSSAMYMKVVCSVNKEWEILYLQPCECASDPPEFALPVYRHWDSGLKAIKTRVEYYCSEEVNSVLFQVATCNDSRKWDILTLTSCECLEDPLDTHFYLSKNVNEIGSHVGSTRIYYCLADPMYGISHVMKCCGNLTWINFITYSCECLTGPPGLIGDEYQTWSGILKSYVNSSVFYHCTSDKSSPVYQTALCNVKRQWSMQHDDTAINLRMKFCKCETAPPKELFGYQRHWKPSLSQIGSEVYYSCTGNATPVLTGVCNVDLTWKLPARVDNITNNCECPELHIDFNLVSWIGIKNRIGSVASVWCLDNNTQLHKQLKCGEDKMWEEMYKDVCKIDVTSTEFITTEIGSTLMPEINLSTEIGSTLMPEIILSTEISTESVSDKDDFVLEIKKKVEIKQESLNRVQDNFSEHTSTFGLNVEDLHSLSLTEFAISTSLSENTSSASTKSNYKKRNFKRLKTNQVEKQLPKSKSNMSPNLVQKIAGEMRGIKDFNVQNKTLMASGSFENVISSVLMAVFEFIFVWIFILKFL